MKDPNLSLTEEENHAVQKMFGRFKKPSGEQLYVKPEIRGVLQKHIIAQALFNYANEQIMTASLDSQKDNRQQLLEKAVISILKAYYQSQLPIYLYKLASLYEAIGASEAAKNYYSQFLELQSKFKPTKIDEMILKSYFGDYDMGQIVKEVGSKLRKI